MTRILAMLTAFLTAITSNVPAFAQDAQAVGEQAMGIDDQIDAAFGPVSEAAAGFIFYSVDIFGQSVPLVLIWLVCASLFFTLYFGFANIRYFKHAIDLLREPTKMKTKDKEGEISRFQALSTSVSGTVGLGNIAGVAVAISVGGPGAMIWMMLMGLFGMSTKFVEISLAVKYRHTTKEGHYSGGPMYYLRDGFGSMGKKKLGWAFGAFFSVCCIGGALGGGNMFQVNQAFQQFVNVTGGEASFMADKGWLFGLIVAVLVAAVIIGGIKSIAKTAEKIVPFMAVLYVAASLIVIGMNFAAIPEAFEIIFKSAFGLDAAAGGFLGAVIAMIQGVRRAAFSNEAGLGSASIAHAAVKTDSHVSQGIVGMLEPFIDTVVICTMTALVIVVSGVYVDSTGMEGVDLTSRAFGEHLSFFPYILALSVILFAFSTMIAWSYYGLKAFTYIFGETPQTEIIFKVIYCLFVVVGGAATMNNIINFMDAAIFAMTIPNIIGLYILAPKLKKDFKAYIAERKVR